MSQLRRGLLPTGKVPPSLFDTSRTVSFGSSSVIKEQNEAMRERERGRVIRLRYRAARPCQTAVVKGNNYAHLRVYTLSLFKRSSYVSSPVSWLARGMHMKHVLNRRRAGCNSCSHHCASYIRSAHIAHPNIEERAFHYVAHCRVTIRCLSAFVLNFCSVHIPALNNFARRASERDECASAAENCIILSLASFYLHRVHTLVYLCAQNTGDSIL